MLATTTGEQLFPQRCDFAFLGSGARLAAQERGVAIDVAGAPRTLGAPEAEHGGEYLVGPLAVQKLPRHLVDLHLPFLDQGEPKHLRALDVGSSRNDERGVRRDDELRPWKLIAKPLHDVTLPPRMQVLLDLIDKPDAALRRIADIIHDLDLRDHKYQRPEAAGIKVILDGLAANQERDEDRIERASFLFEDLYKSFTKVRA